MPSKGVRKPTSRALAKSAALLAADKKGLDVVVLDMRKVADFTDYFVICSGAVDVHLRAIKDHIDAEMSRRGVEPRSVEGAQTGRWILMDYVHFVVHIFTPQARSFYALERLWGDAGRLKIKELEG